MYMYEEQDTLGRRVAWGFDAPQLLVVPRAGWWANAYYERRSHSLQFYSFRAGSKLIHTSLSRDIVAHETAHALIDGIDPDLYDALDPQSLALHEGVADLTAVLIAFRSGKLRRAVLDKTEGSIEKSTNFSSIGEQFGRAIDPSGQAGWLRNLLNEDKLDPDGDPADEPEEHELSQVITGVLYRFLTVLHTDYKRRLAERFGTSTFSVSGRALFGASEQFKRMILRGLDYMPPGEITFADYGRAILAADQASFEDDTWRRWLRENFVMPRDRPPGIGSRRRDQCPESRDPRRRPPGAGRQRLGRLHVRREEPEAARHPAPGPSSRSCPGSSSASASNNRARASSARRPRRRTRRRTPDPMPPSGRSRNSSSRCAGARPNGNPRDLGGATKRRVQTGVTLVIDWDQRLIRSLLRPLDLAGRRTARDAMLRRLMERGLVQVSSPDDPDAVQKTLGTGIEAVVTDGILRVRETARLLHVAKDAGDA